MLNPLEKFNVWKAARKRRAVMRKQPEGSRGMVWEIHLWAAMTAYEEWDDEKSQKEWHATLLEAEKAGVSEPISDWALPVLACLYQKSGDDRTYRALWRIGAFLYHLEGHYRDQGKCAEAESLMKQELTIIETSMGEDFPKLAQNLAHTKLVSHRLNSVADDYRIQGKYNEAEPLFERCLTIRENTLGPVHSDVAVSLNNLAVIYANQGKIADAEPLYKRSLAIAEDALGTDDSNLAATLYNLAKMYSRQGRYTEAEPFFQRSLAIWEKELGPDHPNVGKSLENYGALLRKTDREVEAAAMEARAAAIRVRQVESIPES